MPVTASNPFKWRHYPGDIILWCVRWYLRFPISFAHMAEMALERGLLIHSSCIWRWVEIYVPELDRRCRPHLKRTNKAIASMRPRTVKKLVEYCNTAWNMDGVAITLGGFAEYRDSRPQFRTELA